MDVTTDIVPIVTGLMSDFTDVLIASLPIVLGVIGSLVGLWYVIRLVFRRFGGARG